MIARRKNEKRRTVFRLKFEFIFSRRKIYSLILQFAFYLFFTGKVLAVVVEVHFVTDKRLAFIRHRNGRLVQCNPQKT